MKLRFRLGFSYPEAISTLYCALENGADLHVNERQKIRQYRARSTEERRIRRRRRRRRRKKKNAKSRFFISRGAYINLRYIAMLYTHSIGNQRRTRWWCLQCVIVYLARDIPAFVMYCVKGESVMIIDYHSNKSILSSFTT